MADNEEIAGISVGISASTELLLASLQKAQQDIINWQERQQSRTVELKAVAKIDSTQVDKAKADLRRLSRDLQKEKIEVPVRLMFGVTRTTAQRIQRDLHRETKGQLNAEVSLRAANVEQITSDLNKQLAGKIVPINVHGEWAGWKGDVTPTTIVNVVGHWNGYDNNGGPGPAPGGGGGGAPTGGAPMGGAPGATAGTVICPTCNREFRRGGAYSAHRRAEDARAARDRRDAAVSRPAGTTAPSAETRKAATATGEAVAEAIADQPVKVEPSKKQETRAKTEKAAAQTNVDTRAQIAANRGRPSISAPPQAAPQAAATEDLFAGVSTVGMPPAPISESERFEQGGQAVVHCNQCNQIVPAASWAAHRGVHTRRRRAAEREQFAQAARQQAEVTLHRRGFGDVGREPERAEAIAEFEFNRNIGSTEETRARESAWQHIESAINAGASVDPLFSRAALEPEEGRASDFEAWLKTDDGKQLQTLLQRGMAERRATGGATGPVSDIEARAQALEEGNFTLGAALLRAGIAEGHPQELRPRSRPGRGRINPAAGEIYEANVRLAELELSTRREDIEKRIAPYRVTNAEGETDYDLSPRITEARARAAAAMRMPTKMRKEYLTDENGEPVLNKSGSQAFRMVESGKSTPERRRAISYALGGVPEEGADITGLPEEFQPGAEGLYQIAADLRSTYKRPRSYKRLLRPNNPRDVSSARDIGVLQARGMIDELLTEQRGTSGYERKVEAARELAAETAEAGGKLIKPERVLKYSGYAPSTGIVGGAKISNRESQVAPLSDERLRELAATPSSRRRRSQPEFRGYVPAEPEAPLLEAEEGPQSAELRGLGADLAEIEAGGEIVSCVCGANVPKSTMDNGSHFASAQHERGMAMATGGPRTFASEVNPATQTRGPVGETLSQRAQRLRQERLAGGRPIEAAVGEEPNFIPVWRRRQGFAKDLTRGFAGPYNPDPLGRMRVKDLTAEERKAYRAMNRQAKEAGVEPFTPEEVRQSFAAEAAGLAGAVEVEPEDAVRTAEEVTGWEEGKAPRKRGARLDPDEMVSCTCGAVVPRKALSAHKKTNNHTRLMGKKRAARRKGAVQVAPEGPSKAAMPLNEKDLANLPPEVREKFEQAASEQGVEIGESVSARGNGGGGGGGGTKFCSVCERDVRTRGHEDTVEHKRNLRNMASAGATPGGATTAEEEAAREARYISPSGMRRIAGERTYAELQRTTDQGMTLVDNAIQDINQFGREVLEENPVRALSVAVSQVAVNLTGRAELKNTIGDMNRQSALAKSLAKDASQARQQVQAATKAIANPKVTEETKEALKTALPDLEAEAAATGAMFEAVMGAPLEVVEKIQRMPKRADRERAMRELEQAAVAAEENAEEPQTLLGQKGLLRGRRVGILAKTAAISTVGIVGGTALFSAAMAAFNTAMQFGAEWVGRVTDEMSGFAAQANKLAQDLGQASLASGRVSPAIAARLAQAGIGGGAAAAITPLLAPRVQGEMAAQRTVMMRDTLALAAQQRLTQALHPEIRNFAGVYQPTGGAVLPLLGQTNIGAQQSVQESLAQMLGAQPSNTPLDFLTGKAPALDFLRPIEDFLSPASGRVEDAERQAAKDTLATLNEQIKRGGGAFQFRNPSIAGTTTGGLGAENAQIAALQSMGAAPDFIARVEAGDVALTDANGALLTSTKDLAAAFDALVEGSKPALDQLVQALKRPLEAQFFSIRQSAQRQLEVFTPIQRMMEQAANPIQPFGMGLIPFGQPVEGTAPPAAISAFTKYLPAANDITTRIRDSAEVGWQQFVDAVRKSPVIDNPEQLIGDMQFARDLGTDLAAQQRALAGMQVAQQWHEYNIQVVRAQRNIEDLAGMVADSNGVEASRLGILNSENLAIDRQLTALGRRSQRLSLDQQQRQINFGLATSRFAAAGTTGAEIAARQEQAQLEARVAQEQLDIANQQFGLQGTQISNQIEVVDIQNLRAFQDALVDFDNFQRNFSLAQETTALNDYASKVQTLQQQIIADVGVQVGAIQSAVGAMDDATVQIFRDGAETLEKTADEVKEVFEEVGIAFRESMGLPPLYTGGGNTGANHAGSGGFQPVLGASGLLGTTSTPTGLIVGEAGTETVAVLRNPRTMLTTPTGSAGGSVTVNINNPVVRDETDITALARAVEDVLNRRTTLLGLRR